MDYPQILEKIRKEITRQRDLLGNEKKASEAEKDARALEAWLAQGQSGDCPIDVARYGARQKPRPATLPEPSVSAKMVEKIVLALAEKEPEPIPADLTNVQPETPDQAPVETVLEDPQPQADIAPVFVEQSETPLVDEDASEPAPESQPQPNPELDPASAPEPDLTPEAPSNEDAWLERDAGLETPAEKNLAQQLEAARQSLRAGDLGAARSLAQALQKQAYNTSQQDAAADLLSQASQQFETALQAALDEGDQARQQNQAEAARAAYQRALALDPENNHARRALLEMSGALQHKLSEDRLRLLRGGLRNRRDIQRLGEAVYEAEALDGEDRLPADLQDDLKEARKYYDETRKQMGEETTQMRFGDLSGLSGAVEKIRARVSKGEEQIFDPTSNTWRKTYETLREAETNLKRASEDTAQYELELANKQKSTHPRYAKNRLQQALEYSFSDIWKRQLNEKLAELDTLIGIQEEAESLLAQARAAGDALESFALSLKARNTFASLPGIQAQVDQTRQVALKSMLTRLQYSAALAEQAINAQEYLEAVSAAQKAEELAAQWPESEPPLEIGQALENLTNLSQQAQTAQNHWRDYQKLAAPVREQVPDAGRRAAGLDLFRTISEKPEYRRFADFKVLEAEVGLYKDVGEQLNDAQAARAAGDWERVRTITEGVLKLAKAGAKQADFTALRDEALLEITITRALEYLKNEDVPEANNLLSALVQRNPSQEQALRERLKDAFNAIATAVADNKFIQPLFDQAASRLGLRDSALFRACIAPAIVLRQGNTNLKGDSNYPEMKPVVTKLSESAKIAQDDLTPVQLSNLAGQELKTKLQKRSVDDRLTALSIFRYIGGGPKVEASWPDYRLSLRTAEARRAERVIGESIREDLVSQLRREYQERAVARLEDDRLRQRAGQAARLRELFLLPNDDEKEMARWFELEWGKRQAERATRQNRWDEAATVWQDLNLHYPGHSDVREGLRHALIRQAIGQARSLYAANQGEAALQTLRQVQERPEVGLSADVNFSLAELLGQMGNFEKAFATLREARRLSGDVETPEWLKMRDFLQHEKVIVQALDQANAEWQANPHKALAVLQEALETEEGRNSRRLQERSKQIFDQAAARYLKEAQGDGRGGDDAKIRAVKALVDLQALEEVAGISAAKRESTRELNRLRADLAGVAEKLAQDAKTFEPTRLFLQDAIGQSEQFSNRLQTFDNVMPLFSAELQEVKQRLLASGRLINDTLTELRALKDILDKSKDSDLWNKGLRTGNFFELQKFASQIQALSVARQMPDALRFDARLAEYQELNKHVVIQTAGIKEAFIRQEDFSGVVTLIRAAAEMPALRPVARRPWEEISPEEYRLAYKMASPALSIVDTFGGGELNGWEEVEQAALQRAEDLSLWVDWQRRIDQAMDDAQQVYAFIELQTNETPYREQWAQWEKFRDAAQRTLNILQNLPVRKRASAENDQASEVPVLSARGRKIRAQGFPSETGLLDEESDVKTRRDIVESWLRDCQHKIKVFEDMNRQKPFPTAEEFNDAVKYKNWTQLASLILRAEQAGAITDDEKKRLNLFKKIQNDQRNDSPNKTLFERIFNR